MFPVLPPGGGVDPVPARAGATPAVAATQPVAGVGPLMPVDPQNPRAAALPVNTDAADAARVKAELARGAVLGAAAVAAQDVLPALVALPNNRAAAVAPQLTQLLQLLQALGVAETGEGAPPVVNWPEAGQPVAEEPANALLRLREALGQSPLFAANPRTPAVLAALAQSPWGGGLALAPGRAPGAAQPTVPGVLADPGAAESMAESIPAGQGAAPTELAPAWVSSVPVQPAERAQQALQLLLHGQLQWRGELTPGVPLRLEREDVWQEDPAQPGHLLPGTALRLELLLPGTGPLLVLAQQVAGQMTVRLLPAAAHAMRFEAALAELQTALAPLAHPPVDLALQARAAEPT